MGPYVDPWKSNPFAPTAGTGVATSGNMGQKGFGPLSNDGGGGVQPVPPFVNPMSVSWMTGGTTTSNSTAGAFSPTHMDSNTLMGGGSIFSPASPMGGIAGSHSKESRIAPSPSPPVSEPLESVATVATNIASGYVNTVRDTEEAEKDVDASSRTAEPAQSKNDTAARSVEDFGSTNASLDNNADSSKPQKGRNGPRPRNQKSGGRSGTSSNYKGSKPDGRNSRDSKPNQRSGGGRGKYKGKKRATEKGGASEDNTSNIPDRAVSGGWDGPSTNLDKKTEPKKSSNNRGKPYGERKAPSGNGERRGEPKNEGTKGTDANGGSERPEQTARGKGAGGGPNKRRVNRPPKRVDGQGKPPYDANKSKLSGKKSSQGGGGGKPKGGPGGKTFPKKGKTSSTNNSSGSAPPPAAEKS